MSNSGDKSRGTSRRTALRIGAVGSLGVLGLSSVSQTGAQEGPTTITECREIDESGEYVLGDDLSAEGDCLRITVGDVILDGDGYALRGNGTGVGIRGPGNASSLDVRNLRIRGFETGIRLTTAKAQFDSVTVEENAGIGIRVAQYSGITCTDSTIRRNGGAAIDPDEQTSVTLTDCELRENDGDAVEETVSDRVQIRSSVIADNGGPVYISPLDERDETEVLDSVIRNNAGAGIRTGGTDQPREDEGVPIRNCEIRDNDGPGIDHGHSFLEIRNCTLAGNRDGYRLENPLRSYPDQTILRNNNIEENEGYGVVVKLDRFDNGTPIDATCNWWGDESGPVHEDNPNEDPQGQRVSDDVEFVPWSTERIEDGEGTCDGGLDEEEPDGPPEGGSGYISRKSYMRIKGMGPYEDVDCWGETVYVTDPSDVEDAGFDGPGAITIPASSGDDAEERELPGHVIRAESDAVPVTLPTWGGDRGECESLLFVDPERDLRADVEYRIVTDDPDAAYEEVDTNGFAGTIDEVVRVEYEPVSTEESDEA